MSVTGTLTTLGKGQDQHLMSIAKGQMGKESAEQHHSTGSLPASYTIHGQYSSNTECFETQFQCAMQLLSDIVAHILQAQSSILLTVLAGMVGFVQIQGQLQYNIGWWYSSIVQAAI